MHYTYKTKGTCSQQIEFDLNGNVVTNVSFLGGCNGNLKAISSLVEGMTVEDVEKKVAGIQCGFKGTSCADQLSIALKEAYEAAAQAQQ
ncbi:MAG: TIGR03905 family TSCPD domain-containing protein [Eubacterium sp.]|nr:TIGR03905 family TSCPD domain-containing protein [Eubacterium sp.]